VRKRLLAFAAIVIAIALIATVAVADKRRKTTLSDRAHIAPGSGTHGRAGCGERATRAAVTGRGRLELPREVLLPGLRQGSSLASCRRAKVGAAAAGEQLS